MAPLPSEVDWRALSPRAMEIVKEIGFLWDAGLDSREIALRSKPAGTS